MDLADPQYHEHFARHRIFIDAMPLSLDAKTFIIDSNRKGFAEYSLMNHHAPHFRPWQEAQEETIDVVGVYVCGFDRVAEGDGIAPPPELVMQWRETLMRLVSLGERLVRWEDNAHRGEEPT